MLSETEINQRWVELLNVHGVTIGSPALNIVDNYDLPWAIGLHCENFLTDEEVETHLIAMFEVIKETAAVDDFDLEDVLAQNLVFEDINADDICRGVALFHAPIQSRRSKGA